MRGRLEPANNPLQTPKERFINLISRQDANRGTNGTFVLFVDGNADTAIDLPDGKQLRQSWQPFGPRKLKTNLIEIITRLEQAPQAGGALLDFYYDYIASTTITRRVDIFAEEFGFVGISFRFLYRHHLIPLPPQAFLMRLVDLISLWHCINYGLPYSSTS